MTPIIHFFSLPISNIEEQCITLHNKISILKHKYIFKTET